MRLGTRIGSWLQIPRFSHAEPPQELFKRPFDLMRSGKKQEVVETAYRLFSEKGFHGTTMREICRETNLTTGGIYYYAKSKEDLWNEVSKYVYDELLHMFEKSSGAENERKMIELLIQDLCRFMAKHKNIATILMGRSISRGEGDFAEEIKTRRSDFFNRLRGIVKRARKRRQVNEEIDSTVAAFCLAAIVVWVSLWFREEGRLGVDELGSQLARLFVTGFVPHNAP